jgi:hypothetical protein
MESSEEAQLSTTDNERTTRHTWVKMKKSITNRDGQQVLTFPFLSDDNWQDKVLIRHLLAQRHYAAAHGDVGAAWNAVMEGVAKETHPDTGLLIFSERLNLKTVQSRFKEYMSFVKWHQAQVPFRSGCDDEDPPTEIMDGLESMYDDWTSSVEKSKEKRDAVATKKQNDKVGAEALRRAALGQFVARRAGRDEESNEENVFGVPATPRSNCSSRSNTPVPGNFSNAIHSLEDSLAQRASAKLLKEENKKRKLELLQQKVEN